MKFISEEDMQKDFKGFREGRNQCYTVELFEIPHLYLQRFHRTGQDKPLKNKDRRTISTPEKI